MIFKKELIDFLESENKIKNRSLIEKDLLLHKILLELSKDAEFSENYAFKGGTCLTKAYLGYFRFSEDLDFTFIKQKTLNNISKALVRKKINLELEKLISLLCKISKENNLIFSKDKKDEKYFEFGAGNIFTTIKIYYISLETNKEEFIKLQFNFLENICFDLQEKSLSSLIDKTQEPLLPESYSWLFTKPKLKCYSLQEILCEKVRAILTRKGVKSRDFIDVFKITKGNIAKLHNLKKEIFFKLKLALEYKKYLENFSEHKINIPKYFKGDEEKLLLKPLEENFHEFLNEFDSFLKEIIKNN
jgi:predicted nucleotidyltransferase component of viral defense system